MKKCFEELNVNTYFYKDATEYIKQDSDFAYIIIGNKINDSVIYFQPDEIVEVKDGNK